MREIRAFAASPKPSSWRRLLFAGCAVAGVFAAIQAQAQPCDRSGCGFASCATPAVPVPSNFWGEIQPAEGSFTLCGTQGPAFCRDSTAFNDEVEPYSQFPWFMSIDTENGYVLTALAYGLEVWDARSTPATPAPLGQLALSDFPVSPANPEIKLPLQHVATPDGVDTVAAMAGLSGMGLAVVNLSNKALPKLAYQSYKKEGAQAYAATLNGRQYAFLASPSGAPSGGLFIYDMTTALTYDHCAEAVPATGETVKCPGVYQGMLGGSSGRISVSYVAGVDNFLVLSSGAGAGFEIWDVTQPTNPSLRLSALPSTSVYGVAMWKQGTTYYLALRTDTDARFYDVSCIVGGCGSGLGSPLATRQLDSGTASFYATFSRSGGTPFVYFGSDDECQGGSQREWLFDVTNPASPRDVSPANYWGWYYRGNPTGFNQIMPRSGKFVGSYFYRAALSLFDIHHWNSNGNPSPTIFVGGPTSGAPGDMLTFTADAAICTPNPSGWSWNTSGGNVFGGTAGSSIQVSWSSAGQKSVTAQNSACGTASGLRSVLIASSGGNNLNANFNFSPTSPQPNQPVTFDATSSTGNPQTYNWSFGDGTGGSGATITHSYGAIGAYGVTLTVTAPGVDPSCPTGTCISRAYRAVPVGQLPAPDATFTTDAPCVNLFGFDECTVQIGHAASFTATSTEPFTYNWDFGDGGTATGRTASHAWTTAGMYTMELAVSNGQQTAFQTKLIQAGTNPPPCAASATRLCLDSNRYAVDVTWTAAQGGGTGAGNAVPLTDDTGYFWFFNSSNVEMVIKVLNGCGLNSKFWVFAGGLTNVQVDITVTDTVTGAVKTYHNPPNTPFQPIQDTSAFACSGTHGAAPPGAPAPAPVTAPAPAPVTAPALASPVDPSVSGTLLLDGSRFVVNATWTTAQGQTGSGTGVQLTDNTGYFWFFSSSNVEMVIKVLDGCALNQRFWVFAGGLTNVKVDISVTDSKNGTIKHYTNAQGKQFQPIQDTAAFATCP
ncbi:MAG TPA: PKD domain-containing protein [Thermoanaerobaculia bacterium]|nr:PKD domain-containing protein [Thermoanaerobaculia bacterium]